MREKLSCVLPVVLKVEQRNSQTAQLWDGSKYALLIGAILNHTRDVYEAHLAEQTSIEKLPRFSRKKVRAAKLRWVSSDYDSEVYRIFPYTTHKGFSPLGEKPL